MNPRKIAAFAIGPCGAALLGFITMPIVAWYFSSEDVGRMAMLQIALNFSILLFSLGLDQAYVRDYHESEHKSALFKAALLPGLLLLLMGLVSCFLFDNFISKALFSVDSLLISILIAICILAAFVSRFLSLILRMQERGLAFSMSQVLPKVLFLFVIGAYVFLSCGFDLLHLVIANTLSAAAVTLIYAWNTRQEWLAALKQRVDTEKLQGMLRFGSPLIMGGIAFWGLTAMDKIFLRNLSSFEELGVYSVASSFAAAAIVFQNIFSIVWAPTVYKWAAKNINLEKIDQVTGYVLIVVVILFSLTGLFSWIVTYLLPASYGKVQYILVACMAYPLFYTLSETTAVGLGVTRKSIYAMVASIIAALVSLVSNYLLVPLYGAAGAAISTAIAFWIFLICRTEFSCHVWRPIPRLKLYSMTLICLIVSALFALNGADHHVEFTCAWLVLLIVVIATNNRIIFSRSFN